VNPTDDELGIKNTVVEHLANDMVIRFHTEGLAHVLGCRVGRANVSSDERSFIAVGNFVGSGGGGGRRRGSG
jgi:hypothetical protein